MTKRRKITIIVVALVLIVVAAVLYVLTRSEDNKPEPGEPIYSALTGLEVTEAEAETPLLGVMIENSQEARPQTGLDSAGLVFEATTEAGITRYLALYQEDTPEIVGPVRSLRPHFLDWAMGFDVAFAHVGGSPEALDLANERNAKSLNQFQYSEPYYRDNARVAPHNMYARTSDLRELLDELDYTENDFDPFPRKSDSPAEAPNATNIIVDYSSPTYRVEFRYDPATNSYTRYLAGAPHIDAATNEAITIKNLVVIKADRQDNRIDAVGSGEALVFIDGTVQTVRWENEDFETRIKFVNEDGTEVALNRGDAWIAVLPSDRSVTYE